MNRVNWIDWAKCLAVITVVFCHLPQPEDGMYFRYLQACIITIFFFLSGYLKRDRGSMRDNWRKYLWGLAVPYTIYNVLMLPYWVVRYDLQQGGWPDAAALMKPIVGALLMEHNSSYAEPLNGTLWYLPVILLMHLIVDLCHRTRREHCWLMAICALSVIGHFLYKYYEPHPTMPVMGFLRRLPYFYLGYVMGQQRQLKNDAPLWRNATLCIGSFGVSILLFYWHVAIMPQFMLHVALFYPVNVFFIFGVVYGCKLLQGHTPQWVVNVSIGTLVVVGLQWMFIGVTNHAIAMLAGIDGDIVYTWYEALLVTLFITVLHYPIIILSKQHAHMLLGKK